jgi:GNAT superfamily N-acetyltransferase
MIGQQLEIRPANATDAALVLRFVRGLAEYEKRSHEVVATEERIRAALFGPDPAAEALIASIDGSPVGFALFFHTFSTFSGRRGIFLEDIFVEEAQRGKGAGRALMVRLAAIARERDCSRVEWSVLRWNAPSIAFYESLGAKPSDEWIAYSVKGEALERLADRG